MDIYEQGRLGEQTIRMVLKKMFNQHNLQQLDWVVKWNNKNWYIVEVKNKEMYTKGGRCTFDGTGLDITQINLRKELLDDLMLDTILVTIIGDDLYIAKLSKLEALPPEDKFDTPNGVRIYNIERFKKYANFKDRLQ